MIVAAKRSPDGYVAQRIAVDPDGQPRDPRGPWVRTYLNSSLDLTVELLTDEQVEGWPDLSEDGARHGELCDCEQRGG